MRANLQLVICAACSSSSRLDCAGGASECVFMHTVTAVMLDCCSSSNQEML